MYDFLLAHSNTQFLMVYALQSNIVYYNNKPLKIVCYHTLSYVFLRKNYLIFFEK